MTRPTGQPQWRDPGLLVMGSLSSGAKHGYAITQDVSKTLGIALGPGTLYGALARLEERHLIEALAGDERRRPYRLTATGIRVLSEQTEGMLRFAAIAKANLSKLKPNAAALELPS
jgi:DNA-binding PadR family transcriptional regulator